MNGKPVYEIRVRGILTGDLWAAQFDGMDVQHEAPGITRMVGEVEDQAALYGLLSRLRNLALPLLSVRLVET